MPALVESSTSIPLKSSKPVGLNDLGVPMADTTVVKKGSLGEFTQSLDDGKVGRRYQGFRVVGIKTVEGGAESAKIFLEFEVFGDNNVAPETRGAFEAVLYAGDEKVASFTPATVFLPYANYWYANRYVFDIPAASFEAAERLDFIAKPGEVGLI